MKNFIKLFLAVAVVIVISASCEHKALIYDHHLAHYWVQIYRPVYDQDWQYASTNNTPDWSEQWDPDFGFSYDSLRPTLPAGLRVLANDLTGKNQQSVSNIDELGGRAYLAGKDNSLLIYNNDTEYLIFSNLGTQTAATATTRTRTRSTYLGNQFSSEEVENTVAPPDMLYACYIDNFHIDKRTFEEDIDTLSIHLHPLVYTYFVRYEVTYGMQYFGIARGALSGMAGSVYLHNGHTTEQVVTVIYDCETVEDFGARAYVKSFGIPNHPNDAYTRGNQNYALNIEIRLRNGRMVNYDFDVTDQVRLQPHGGVIEVTGIEIPDSVGRLEGSGFDIEVDGWGEYVDVDIPLGGNN
jgi:hypothetical protein